jgi:hypothetical protein
MFHYIQQKIGNIPNGVYEASGVSIVKFEHVRSDLPQAKIHRQFC